MNRRLARLLRERWAGEDRRVAAIISDLRAGTDWTPNLLASSERMWEDLPQIKTCPKSGLTKESPPRDLRGIYLSNIDLTGVKGLADTCLDFCILTDISLNEASLVGSSLNDARVTGTSFIDRADFRGAKLIDADLRGVSLANCNFTDADLRGTNLEEADIRGSKFKNCSIRKLRSLSMALSRRTKFGGDYQESRLLNEESDGEIRRFISSEVGRLDLEKSHPGLAFFWFVLANYGRSPARLLFWVVVVWLVFGLLYAGYPVPRVLAGTSAESVLILCAPVLRDATNNPIVFGSKFEPYYFSVATLTTLGYGDITPSPSDWLAQVMVSCEAVLGYIFLGSFISAMIQSMGPRE